MIIIEGVDGGGKGRLIETLQSEEILHKTVVKSPGPMAFHSEWCQLELWRPEPNLVMYDRFPFFSEAIYGPIIRGYCDISPVEMAWLSLEMYQKQPLIIHCQPPFETVLETSQVQEQMEGVHEHLQELYTAYDVMMHRLKVLGEVVTYDFTAPEAYTEVLGRLQCYEKRRYSR